MADGTQWDQNQPTAHQLQIQFLFDPDTDSDPDADGLRVRPCSLRPARLHWQLVG
jgi:hypothetical protein